MKKSVLFSLFLVLMLSMTIVSSAQFPIGFPREKCSESQLDQTRTLTLKNGCGGEIQLCKYIPPRKSTGGIIGPKTGFWWTVLEYNPGEGVCCDPTGGYATYITQCDTCRQCGFEAACDVLFPPEGSLCQEEGSSGYCIQGTCDIDESDPVIKNNQDNIYIRDVSKIEEIYNLTIDVDFSDDLKLKEYRLRICDENSSQYFVNRSKFFPAPEIIEGCATEIIPLTGKNFTEDRKLSVEMWNWIIDTVLNQGKVSVNIDLFDSIGKESFGNQLFFIISDFTPPELSITHTLLDVPDRKQAKITAIANDSFNEFETSIFIDGKRIGEVCTRSTCLRSRVYSSGSHSFYAVVEDASGNKVVSTTETFNLETGPSTCEEFFGQVCVNGTMCSQETFSASDTTLCCSGSCISEVVEVKTCEEQGGSVFNPNTHTCQGQEVAAEDLGSFLRCCIQGEIKTTSNIDLLKVFWEDQNGNKIASASFGDNVKCSASGTVGTAEFIISKDSEIESKSLTLPNSLSVSVKESGIYECSVNLNEDTKKAELKVLEAPAQPQQTTALPGFGFFNALIALSLIIAYYLYRKRW